MAKSVEDLIQQVKDGVITVEEALELAYELGRDRGQEQEAAYWNP